MAGAPFREPGHIHSGTGCVSGIALLAAAQAIAAPTPIVQRDAPQPATTVTSEQLERLPASRDLRAVLNLHNQLRAEVGARPLRWNPTLAEHAQQYADVLAETGTVQHSSRIGRENQRENIVVGRPSGISPAQMVQIWINEGRLFRSGTFPNVSSDGNWASVGHYTQMIWPTTTDLGCAYAQGRFDALVCRYSPPGNRDGVIVGPGPSVPRQAGALCTSPGGMAIPCQNVPEGGGVVEDGGGDQDSGDEEDVACVVDINVHKPISLDPNEPVIPQRSQFKPGATTLRNDDSDWRLGEAPDGELPIISLPIDIERTGNANENDLVKVQGLNPNGLPGVYLFAFPTHAEASRNLGARVQPVVNGRHANERELAYFQAATKAPPAPALPLLVPRATTFWLEALLGGQYRMVIGKLAAQVAPGDVRYDRDRHEAYAMRERTRVPAFVCQDQATVTAAVVDIFQSNGGTDSERNTAFDVYWSGRPHFRADVWPGGERFTWGAPYRLGANLHNMPGEAVTGKVAFTESDDEDVDRDSNATIQGEEVVSSENSRGGFGDKRRIEGGFQMQSLPGIAAGDVPAVNRDPANRYPDRVSLRYEVNGEALVRAEYLEVILPQVRAPDAPAGPVAGTATRVESQVRYTIVDAFNRPITAKTVDDYVHLYGAGLKAWEALEGQQDKVVETGPNNDHLFITDTGLDARGRQRPPVGPLGTAQRSQTRVLPDRMTEGTFQDTLVFTAPADADDRKALWIASTGPENETAQQARSRLAGIQAQAQDRDDALQGRTRYDPQQRNQSPRERREEAQRRREAVPQADQGRIVRSTLMAIPQDVILQLRVGAERRDLMVFEDNRLTVYAPYFFEDSQYPGDKRHPVFRYHIEFRPGAATSQLVDADHRRPD